MAGDDEDVPALVNPVVTAVSEPLLPERMEHKVASSSQGLPLPPYLLGGFRTLLREFFHQLVEFDSVLRRHAEPSPAFTDTIDLSGSTVSSSFADSWSTEEVRFQESSSHDSDLQVRADGCEAMPVLHGTDQPAPCSAVQTRPVLPERAAPHCPGMLENNISAHRMPEALGSPCLSVREVGSRLQTSAAGHQPQTIGECGPVDGSERRQRANVSFDGANATSHATCGTDFLHTPTQPFGLAQCDPACNVVFVSPTHDMATEASVQGMPAKSNQYIIGSIRGLVSSFISLRDSMAEQLEVAQEEMDSYHSRCCEYVAKVDLLTKRTRLNEAFESLCSITDRLHTAKRLLMEEKCRVRTLLDLSVALSQKSGHGDDVATERGTVTDQHRCTEIVGKNGRSTPDRSRASMCICQMAPCLRTGYLLARDVVYHRNKLRELVEQFSACPEAVGRWGRILEDEANTTCYSALEGIVNESQREKEALLRLSLGNR
ncbi:hypothetical protein TRVL_05244 [Trypanosoma vivax]|nr:hypothetical protein TRVL_05244 [Trypanosoma vivax]